MYYFDDPHDWNINGWPGEFIYGDDVYIDDGYMEERWKPIDGFEGEYWVSNFARVWSVKSQRFLKVKPMDNHGHLGVCLHSNGEKYYRYIHRLVAEAFIPNHKKLPIVRHLYDNPEENTYLDLAWGTQKDNMYDAIRNNKAYRITEEDREKGLEGLRTPIRAINLDTGDILIFKGQGEASRVLGIPQANIWKVLNNQRKHAKRYKFEYIERGEDIGYY